MPDWDGTFVGAIRLLPIYATMYEQCEAKRQAWQECFARLKQQNVVK